NRKRRFYQNSIPLKSINFIGLILVFFRFNSERKMFTSIDSVEKLNDFIESNNATPETTKTIILLFTGTKNSAGKSWCPDCNVADPIIEKVHNDLNDPNLTIATVFVGDLSSWKNGENPFRRHPKFQVNCVPTLIHLEKRKLDALMKN
ncbi:Thioredoxin domain-containing protein 17, partial [Sarcoptes scabiei]